MAKNIIFNKISDLIQEITNKFELLKESDDIHKIEVDIVKYKIRELYELIGAVDQIVFESNTADENIVTEEVSDPVEIQQERVIEEVVVDETTVSENEEPEVKAAEDITAAEQIPIKEFEIIEDTQQADEPAPESPQEQEEQVKKEENLVTPKTGDLFSNTAAGTIADKFKNTQQSLYDKISDSNDDKSISSKMQKQHINDLKSAIGINEKFLFMNELFDGELNNYNDAINKLNQFDNPEDAIAYFTDLEVKFKWDKSIQSYSQLKSMIERKFN